MSLRQLISPMCSMVGKNLTERAMAGINIKTIGEDKVIEFFDSFDTVLTDCDGVLWINADPLPNAATVLNTFRTIGKRVFYVTNNSTHTRETFFNKCRKLNFEATKEDAICTANLTARYLKSINFQKKVYLIGSKAIEKELEQVGISCIGVGPDLVEPGTDYILFARDPDIGAVIVGFDEHFSYPKMVKATAYLSNPNVHFIGTNTDEGFPGPENIIKPGTGCLVRCIESCAGRKATIMGKPESYVAQVLKELYNVSPGRTLMIGDRANTDILLGTRCGFKTLLVLTGVTKLKEVELWKKSSDPAEKDLVPDYYIDSLGDLVPYLQKKLESP